MRRMITRLLMAKLMSVGIRFATKAFRKNRAAANQSKLNEASNTDALNHDEVQRLEANGQGPK